MSTIEQKISRLHGGGLVDLHFDLPLGLFLNRARRQIIATDFLPEFEAGDIGVLGVALYVEDKYLGPGELGVALDQVALLKTELEVTPRLVLCRTFAEIEQARKESRIALLLTMEGAEPLGTDLHLLRIFHELGLRAISLTHARENAAAAGGVFAPSGSPAHGLTSFGRELVQECERLGIILDLAHINPAGFEEIFALTTRSLIVSHSNARHFYDIERNISDQQIKMIGARGGVVGINAILVSPKKEEATLDRYVDHIEHVAELIGIEGVGIGFDFCEFLWRQIPEAELKAMEKKLTTPHFLSDLAHHGQGRNLTRRLIERGFSDEQIEKILRGNWLRVLRELL
ncbi:MAG TPA: membrane dipeptidase [Chthoniobacterales bacterium]|jgi:membrane dipeptidase|nr:membrane dipeptidase [Chthoniobacterales bacterium]